MAQSTLSTNLLLPTLSHACMQGTGDRQYTELIADDQRPQRNRPPVMRLLRFAIAVAFTNAGLLATAYGLLLLALVFRLAVPKIEGAIFDDFAAFNLPAFRSDLLLAVLLVTMDVCLSVRHANCHNSMCIGLGFIF
jgi:hypothetical protein